MNCTSRTSFQQICNHIFHDHYKIFGIFERNDCNAASNDGCQFSQKSLAHDFVSQFVFKELSRIFSHLHCPVYQLCLTTRSGHFCELDLTIRVLSIDARFTIYCSSLAMCIQLANSFLPENVILSVAFFLTLALLRMRTQNKISSSLEN